ncbi:outer membrane beta-barrel protein [Flavobacterium sp.]|uniref:outer membrane beta-barrel protein n=1 Tax=Flavobacterium sp. TaxID=239 RepID=UPI00261E2AB8|nr:outer membrane beta-barrel protein [Flavobacterium sp.]
MTRFTWTFFALLSLNFIHGQIREAGTFEVVPVLGYSWANYYGNDGDPFGNINSINVGAHADYYFDDRWSLRSGIFYQTMGATVDAFKDKHSFLTIPLNMNWHFGGNRGWNLNFGPNFGYLVNTESTFNGQELLDSEPVRKVQAGISLGIGYKFAVSDNISVLIDYQEQLAITKVFKTSEIDLFNSFSSINVGAVFSL